MSARARSEFARFGSALRYAARLGFPRVIGLLRFKGITAYVLPRPRYCECCKLYAWCTFEMAAYSTAHGFLCEDCAIDNEKETEHAWASFYGRY